MSSETSFPRRVTTPQSTSGLRLPSLARRSSRAFLSGASAQSFSTRLAAPSASAELQATVERTRAAAEVFRETTAAVKYVSTENAMMEELLHEKHRMLTNTDLAVIMSSVMHRGDGTQKSSILASRKPPVLKCKQRALASLVGTTSFEPQTRGFSGPVNFAVLIEQQQEELSKAEESRQAYDAMIADFMTKQQSLSERFAGLL
jgi:hypothetical protein